MASPFYNAVLDLGPALYWPLDAIYLAADQSGNGRNGTGGGGITIGGFSPGPLAAGDDDGATDFDGTDDRVTSTYNPFANGSTRTFTGWAYRDASGVAHTLFGSSVAPGSDPLLRLQAGSNDVIFGPQGTATGPITWTNAWPGNGVWVHWALVFNESTDAALLYINGVLVSTQTTTRQYAASPGNFRIGIRGTTGSPFDGKMAHVAVVEGGLTAAQITALYAARLASPPPVALPTAQLRCQVVDRFTGEGVSDLWTPRSLDVHLVEHAPSDAKVSCSVEEPGVMDAVIGNAVASANTVQQVTVVSSSSGPSTFTMTFNGQTTSAIDFFDADTDSTILAALEALSNIAPGDVLVRSNGFLGLPNDHSQVDITIQFTGTYAGELVPTMTASDTNLTGEDKSATVEVTAKGGEWTTTRPTPLTKMLKVYLDKVPLYTGVITKPRLVGNGEVELNALDAPFLVQSSVVKASIASTLRQAGNLEFEARTGDPSFGRVDLNNISRKDVPWFIWSLFRLCDVANDADSYYGLGLVAGNGIAQGTIEVGDTTVEDGEAGQGRYPEGFLAWNEILSLVNADGPDLEFEPVDGLPRLADEIGAAQFWKLHIRVPERGADKSAVVVFDFNHGQHTAEAFTYEPSGEGTLGELWAVSQAKGEHARFRRIRAVSADPEAGAPADLIQTTAKFRKKHATKGARALYQIAVGELYQRVTPLSFFDFEPVPEGSTAPRFGPPAATWADYFIGDTIRVTAKVEGRVIDVRGRVTEATISRDGGEVKVKPVCSPFSGADSVETEADAKKGITFAEPKRINLPVGSDLP